VTTRGRHGARVGFDEPTMRRLFAEVAFDAAWPALRTLS
jgi:hypothetical protein